MTKSREYLLYNAVLSWLSKYGKMEDAKNLTPQYEQLKEELKAEYEQSESTPVHKRGRPAKRQRTKKTTSSPSSTEKSKKIPYENQKEVDTYMKRRSKEET